MKRILIAAGAACLALPGTAHASETYIGVSGGVSWANDSANAGEFDSTVPATPDWGAIPAGTSLGWDTEFSTGYALSGQVGIKFDSGFRAELELAYSDNGVKTHSGLAAGGTVIDNVDVAVLTRGAPSGANPTVGQVIADDDGGVTTIGGYLNAYYDIKTWSSFAPYIGAGIGYRNVKVDYQPSGVPVADDSDSGLAWQLMAGASFVVSDKVDLFAQYTYRDSFDRAEVPLDLVPATLGVESTQSLVTLGLRLKLGS
jgi:opacity protein-like surface antigen